MPHVSAQTTYDRRTFLKVLSRRRGRGVRRASRRATRWPTSPRRERDRVLRLHPRARRVGRDPLGRPAQRGARHHPPRLDREHRHLAAQPLGRRAARRGASRRSSWCGPTGRTSSSAPASAISADMADRITVINGLAMNTVTHPDGTAFSATGRHPAGRARGRVEHRHHARERARARAALPDRERAVPVVVRRRQPRSPRRAARHRRRRLHQPHARRAPRSTTRAPSATA